MRLKENTMKKHISTSKLDVQYPSAGQNIEHSTSIFIQARIAQLVAYRLGTGELPGSNPGKSKNFSGKISNRFIRI